MARTYEGTTSEAGVQNALPSEEYVARAMPPILGTFDMVAIYVLAIFWITNTATAASGGAAGYIYWIICGLAFFLPCVVATAQLGEMFPHEGSIYNWTHKALGPYWSFLIGLCWWFPAPLVMVGAADTIVTYIQGLNSNWLVQPWQQGIAIIVIIAASSVVATQRTRTVQHMINVAACMIFLAVALLGLSGIIWLLKGHPSATSFSHSTDWTITPSNYNLFGLIALAYLGTQVPLNMGGEAMERRAITRHILWGTVLVFVGYFIATFALLVVEGPSNGATPFALIASVDTVLGKFAGDITVICIIGFFFMAAVMYNCTFARMLFTASIDQRLPRQAGKLSKHRVPVNSIILQTIIAVAFAVLVFLVVPSVGTLGKPSDLATIFYNVALAVVEMVWTLTTIFLFVNLAILYRRDRRWFNQKRIFPMPVLWACIVLGPIAGVIAIYDALFYSWIPQIGNDKWWYIVGGLTLICLVFSAVGSILATSEAAWQGMNA